MPTVYVLYSLKTGKRYVGSTSRTAAERLIEHNSGKVPFTKKHRPLEIVYTETMASLLLAQKRERFFKTGKGRRDVVAG